MCLYIHKHQREKHIFCLCNCIISYLIICLNFCESISFFQENDVTEALPLNQRTQTPLMDDDNETETPQVDDGNGTSHNETETQQVNDDDEEMETQVDNEQSSSET